VRDVVENLVAEIDLTLGLSGCSSFAELGREHLVENSPRSSVPE
jgi:isopentenyl diphosphate isomerase/L-lactate dehydrogenase-like FMN-dependent dehydrogenase